MPMCIPCLSNDNSITITIMHCLQDLSDFLAHSRMAGSNLKAVTDIMRQVGACLQYMHRHGRIHGDLKPRNILKVVADERVAWILADLDASCEFGALAGQKVTSSGFFPPEMARTVLHKTVGGIESVLASQQFELW